MAEDMHTRWECVLADLDGMNHETLSALKPGALSRILIQCRAAVAMLIEEQKTAETIADACQATGILDTDDVPSHIMFLAQERQDARREIHVARKALRAEFVSIHDDVAADAQLLALVDHACRHHGGHHDAEFARTASAKPKVT